MYTAFYGLREKPFALSPDPRFLYLAAPHREALAHLLYGIEQGEGFILVTGEVGTGKTTLCRTLLERLEGEIEVAFLFNPSRTALELLQSICVEFGLPAEGLARRNLMAQLNGFLLEKKREGRRVLLIIDEAQTLSENTLEQVRLLSNLETSREKLIQILLLGQPELDRKLAERSLRQLRQRISVRWQLSPLAAVETRAYVRHRLSVAAGEPKGIFTDAALREVHRRTGGIPRLVNQLCDRALLGGYAARADKIGPSLIRVAAKEIPDTRNAREGGMYNQPARPWLVFAAMCGLVGIGLIAGLQVGRTGLTDAMQSSLFSPAMAYEVATQINDDAALAQTVRPNVSAAPPSLARPIGPVAQEASTGNDLPSASGVMPVLAHNIIRHVSALTSGVLPELLAQRDSLDALAATEQVLLELFGRRRSRIEPVARTVDALRVSLERRGLEATVFEGGSLALLRRLDHPVALALQAADGDARATPSPLKWVAVVGFEADRVRVAGLMADREVTVSVEEFEALWSETGIIVWERFEPLPEALSHNDQGGSVVWLQRALGELDFHQQSPTGRFDTSTRDAVKRFQKERGLVVDGVAGPLTQIALYGRLERYPVPRLSTHRPQSVQQTSSTETFSDSPPNSHQASVEGEGERG